MSTENTLTDIRKHYENYPYPPVDPKREKSELRVTYQEPFDRLNYYCFGGKLDTQKPLRMLVAGGGTGDSLIMLAEQLRGTPGEVVYLDISKASMEIAKERARIRKLENIRWVRDSLLNIPQLGLGMFDYINCSGVLHHLSDPPAGLAAITGALKDDGAMGIMVYAKHGRMAVYQMQEAMRLINQGEDDLQAKVDNTKLALASLPPNHWFRASVPTITNEVATDEGIYDLLLHSQDRAYSVPEFHAYLHDAGLQVAHFVSEDKRLGNLLYDPAGYIGDPGLLAKARALAPHQQQQLAELLHGHIIRHLAYVARQKPALPDPRNLEIIPVVGYQVTKLQEAIASVITQSDMQFLLRDNNSGAQMLMQKTPYMADIYRRIDGKRSLRAIFSDILAQHAGNDSTISMASLGEEFVNLFTSMVTHDWLLLRDPQSSYALSMDELQQRVSAMYGK